MLKKNRILYRKNIIKSDRYDKTVYVEYVVFMLTRTNCAQMPCNIGHIGHPCVIESVHIHQWRTVLSIDENLLIWSS